VNYIKVVAVLLLSCLSGLVLASSSEVGLEEAYTWAVDPITLLAVVGVIFIIVIKAHFKHAN
jgi:hypothetical protein